MQDTTAAHKEWMGWGLCPEPGSFACYDEPSLNWGYLVMVKGSWGDTFQASTHGGHWDFGEGCMGCVPSPVLHLSRFLRAALAALRRWAGLGGEGEVQGGAPRSPAGRICARSTRSVTAGGEEGWERRRGWGWAGRSPPFSPPPAAASRPRDWRAPHSERYGAAVPAARSCPWC